MIELALVADAAIDLDTDQRTEHAHHCASDGPDRDVVLDVDLDTDVEA